MDFIEILTEAIKKQDELLSHKEWRQELLSLAPPVLWFGNNDSLKSKIVSIGANPSRSEFLDGNKSSLKNVKSEDLPYLQGEEKRFYHFNREDTLEDKIKYGNDIIKSYNLYFNVNPYKWFGRENGYCVEALMNGLDASFYNNGVKQALHIDLFPFATMSDFTSILSLFRSDILKDNWNKKILETLIEALSPELLIVFGKTNFKYFKDIFKDEHVDLEDFVFKTEKGDHKTNVSIGKFRRIKMIGISLNLGNPIGFKREDLVKMGKKINEKIGEI